MVWAMVADALFFAHLVHSIVLAGDFAAAIIVAVAYAATKSRLDEHPVMRAVLTASFILVVLGTAVINDFTSLSLWVLPAILWRPYAPAPRRMAAVAALWTLQVAARWVLLPLAPVNGASNAAVVVPLIVGLGVAGMLTWGLRGPNRTRMAP